MEDVRISPAVANTFFALADAGLMPGWAIAIAPVDKLKRACDSSTPILSAFVGEGVVLLQPLVEGGTVRFPLGMVGEVQGEVEVRCVTTGEAIAVTLPTSTSTCWVLDGDWECSS